MKIGLRGKILIAFLALTLISVGFVSTISFRSLYEVGMVIKQNTIDMGDSIVNESISALEDLGRRLVHRRALYVASEIDLFIRYHPSLNSSELMQDEDLKRIAVQGVGNTGYTMVYDKSYIAHFHPDPKMVSTNLHNTMQGEVVHFWSILERSQVGEASGYYDWEDDEGNVRSKYMYCVPVEGTDLIVAASTYIDEYSAPAGETKEMIASVILTTSRYIDEQMEEVQYTFFLIIIGVIIIASGVIFLLSRTITRPLLALTKGAEVIGKGELDYNRGSYR